MEPMIRPNNILLCNLAAPASPLQGANLQPAYTIDEERFNTASHLVGSFLSLLFCVLAFMAAMPDITWQKSVSIIIYSLSMLILYSMSAVYHGMPQGKSKIFFRTLDHCTIYLLIAGCYTPFCLIVFWTQPMGKTILLTEWSIAAIGILLNLVNMNAKPVKCFSQISYVLMGWLIVFVMPLLIEQVPFFCVMCLFMGGIFYTVGILFYGLGKRIRYMHCLWHVFVLLGFETHFNRNHPIL